MAKDYASAFPVRYADDSLDYGMWMRDYFAGQALSGLHEELRSVDVAFGNARTMGDSIMDRPKDVAKRLAEISYFIADAMMEQRSR